MAEDQKAIEIAINEALRARQIVESYVAKYPEFRFSLEPIDLGGEHPRVIELMLGAAKKAEVGPFAAVAGAIAEVACEAGWQKTGKSIAVENGGDIQAMGSTQFTVGIYAGSSPLSGELALRLRKSDLPAGICTSSGTVGHSLSFGWSDATVVIADQASLADACATAIGNVVRGGDREAVKKGLELVDQMEGIRGVVIIKGSILGLKGKIPEICPLSGADLEVLE